MKKYIFNVIFTFFVLDSWAMDIQLRRSSPSTTSQSFSLWAHSYCIPGLLVGAGITLSASTYFNSASLNSDQKVLEGIIGVGALSAGLIWYGINSCIHRLAQDIQDLTAYNV